MHNAASDRAPVPALGRDPHVLLVAPDQQARYALADLLLDAGFRLTLASSVEMTDTLLDSPAAFDLLVATPTPQDLCDGTLTQLARAARPGMPILLLEQGTAGGPGVLGAAVQLMHRWPACPAA